MLTGGSGLQPHDKTQGTKDMSPSQFSRTLDFKEKTANLWHANTSLLSFPIKGQQRTQLLHHYNSFYMKFSIYLDKGNVIRELSEIPSRYQTAGISLRNLPSSWITAYEKKMLSTKRFCHENVGFSTKLLQKNKNISVARKSDGKWCHLYHLICHCKCHLRSIMEPETLIWKASSLLSQSAKKQAGADDRAVTGISW